VRLQFTNKGEKSSLQLWLPAARAGSLAGNSGSIRTMPLNQTIFMLFISLSLFPSNEKEIHIGTQAEKAGSSFAT
jgi:hypothetical protein